MLLTVRTSFFVAIFIITSGAWASPTPEQIESEFYNLPLMVRQIFSLAQKSNQEINLLGLRARIRQTVVAFDKLGPTAEESEAVGECRQTMQGGLHGLHAAAMAPDCLYKMARQYRVSDRLDYINVSFFEKTAFGYKSRQRFYYEPEHELREFGYDSVYVSVAETVSPSYSLASVIENYLLDPQFALKRPATHFYLRRLFQPNEYQVPLHPVLFLNVDEEPFLDTDKTQENPRYARWVDPRRIYGVYVAYATEGKKLLSRWGHIDVVLAICARERPVVNADCLQDTDEHLSLGFTSAMQYFKYKKGAFVKPLLDGVTGRYDSRMTVHSYKNARDEYLRQKREMYLYELQLTPEQKIYLTYMLSEQAYIFRGHWNHLTSNCVNLMSFLLNGVFDRYDLQMQAETLTTPHDLIESLREKNLLKGESLTL